MSYSVSIRDVVKQYGDFNAVDHISVDIKNGEFFTLLGPSGCGKTTLLRMIAGFNPIDGGEIYFGETCINTIPAHKRNIGMVFQNYAVFPHMTVADNVAYGLKARNMKGEALAQRVQEGLNLMKIDALKDRRPSQLSGGQQQRVALARAIVIHPHQLLMDEPLSNLDAKLRLEMRSSIRKLQQSLGITTIYVTHDQDEALAISDRIAVINQGKIAQVDVPSQIYQKPANTFVANFIGTSNFIPGQSTNAGLEVLGKPIKLTLEKPYLGDIIVSVRPEEVLLGQEDGVPARVTSVTFLGTRYEYELTLANDQVIIANQYTMQTAKVYAQGDEVRIGFSTEHMNIYTGDGKEALL